VVGKFEGQLYQIWGYYRKVIINDTILPVAPHILETMHDTITTVPKHGSLTHC